MREIKFKYYFENTRSGGICSIVYTLLDIENGSPVEDIDENVELRLIKRVQHTGLEYLREELYEGDILELEGKDYPIKYIHGCFWCADFPLYKLVYSNRIRTVGNIYENKELLNEN